MTQVKCAAAGTLSHRNASSSCCDSLRLHLCSLRCVWIMQQPLVGDSPANSKCGPLRWLTSVTEVTVSCQDSCFYMMTQTWAVGSLVTAATRMLELDARLCPEVDKGLKNSTCNKTDTTLNSSSHMDFRLALMQNKEHSTFSYLCFWWLRLSVVFTISIVVAWQRSQ